MTDRRLEYMPLSKIEPAPRNPKRHNDAGLVSSIETWGAVEAVVLDERTGRLVSGHGRVEAFAALRDSGAPPPEGVTVRKGEWLIPVQRGWASTDDAAAERVLIALNRHVEAGGWDDRELAAMLASFELDTLEAMSVGFTDAEIELFEAMARATPTDPGEPEPDEIVLPENPVTQPGDVWEIGPHLLICGDARDIAVVQRVVGDRHVDLAFTSPPYADRRVYDEASEFEPVPPDEYVEWFAPIASNVATVLADDGSWFVNIRAGCEGLDKETYVMDLVLAHVRRWGWHWVDEYCWERGGIPRAVDYRFKNAWESVHQFARGKFKFYPDEVRHYSANVPTGLVDGDALYGSPEKWQGRGRPRRNGVSTMMSEAQGTNAAPGLGLGLGLAYPSNRLPTFSGSHEATGHTAAFPVGLPEFFVRAYTAVGDLVLDPFAGSGSTIIAAGRNGRVSVGVEISPAYCDVIIERAGRHLAVEAIRR